MNDRITQIFLRRIPPIVALLALLAVPCPAAAQDDRSDDPVEQVSGAGAIAQPPRAGLLSEPKLLTNSMERAINRFGGGGASKDGFYPELSNMITGSGFLSVGPGYRKHLFQERAFIDVSAAASWHLYKMAQARFEATDLAGQRLTLGTQAMWQDHTQVNYFGIGTDTIESSKSQYRSRNTDVVGYAAFKLRPWLAAAGEAGWLVQPKVLPAGGSFKPFLPNASEAFPGDPGMASTDQPDFLHTEASITADTRDYRSHPTHGGFYRAALTTYADRDAGTFSFRQYEAEAGHFIPVRGDSTWILALHGWVVASDVPNGHDVPFYLLPALGGHNTLRSYSNFRYHDRNLAVVNVESRWALFTHVDGAVFFDAGNVAARVSDLNLDKTSVGGGLRVHTERVTWARVDVAHGAEGWQFIFRTSDPFRLTRFTRRVAAIPFVP